jgi:hypothetical protein
VAHEIEDQSAVDRATSVVANLEAIRARSSIPRRSIGAFWACRNLERRRTRRPRNTLALLRELTGVYDSLSAR